MLSTTASVKTSQVTVPENQLTGFYVNFSDTKNQYKTTAQTSISVKIYREIINKKLIATSGKVGLIVNRPWSN